MASEQKLQKMATTQAGISGFRKERLIPQETISLFVLALLRKSNCFIKRLSPQVHSPMVNRVTVLIIINIIMQHMSLIPTVTT
ncbi:hypothetical protein BFS14_08445 [Serratia fonticola]|nr:hypothetical protein BFS14_08445 [Serratia fonticola]